MKFPKPKTWRNKKHLEFVRALPCENCGSTEDVQAHHLIGKGNLRGIGMKVPDWATMPLCNKCHANVHLTSEVWPEQWEWIAKTLGKVMEK